MRAAPYQEDAAVGACRAALPAKPREALQALDKGLGAKGGGVEAFVEALWAAEGALGEQFPRLDKKREKGVQQGCRAAWRQQLDELADGDGGAGTGTGSTVGLVVLQLALLLLLLDVHGAVLFPVPARLLPALLSLLEPPKLGAAAHATLTHLATLLQKASDTSSSEAGSEADAALASEELTTLIEQVRQLGLNKGQ